MFIYFRRFVGVEGATLLPLIQAPLGDAQHNYSKCTVKF